MPQLCGDFARLLQTCRTASYPVRCVVDYYALRWGEEHETLFVQHLRCWQISANAHDKIIVRVSMNKASQSSGFAVKQYHSGTLGQTTDVIYDDTSIAG